MNILIDTIRIAGFRGIKNLEVSLPRITVLIGTNNSGKTSLIKAMQLAIGDYARFLSEEDFYIDLEDKRTEEILVDIRVIPVDDDGNRTPLFNEIWATEFGDKIKSEANANQFMAIRTRSKQNLIKGGFDTLRFTLEAWPAVSNWQVEKIKETKLPTSLSSLLFISIEAQRDIHQELKEKSSFVGKVLSSVEYNSDDITNLESLIKAVNDEAVNKSGKLQSLKTNLSNLSQSFGGYGNAEITPFPKKIRDLSKHFSIHFGENSVNSFSMEYHGMGTRSWASMLTVKSFIDLMEEKHTKESEPFFPILAAEEPEAHLHPNAQKTLYRQLSKSKGQVIVSTHSPYLVAMANIMQIRSLGKNTSDITVHHLSHKITKADKNVLAREIMSKRGEIIFSKAIILCEGVTEEQVLPAMFEIYTKISFWDVGVSCISVGGTNYSPFIRMACSLGIPTYIISDNDGSIKKEVEAQIRRLKKDTGLSLKSDIYGIRYLNEGNDFEAELLKHGLRDEINEALVLCETKGSDNKRYREVKIKEICSLSDTDIITKMRSSKASYAGFLADVLKENPKSKSSDELLPQSIRDTFDAIKSWLTK